MSLTIKRAHGNRLIYKNRLEASKIVDNLVIGDEVIWFDSDSNYFWKATKDSDDFVDVVVHWNRNRDDFVSYENVVANQALYNAYNPPSVFTDKSQVYEMGPVWEPDNLILVFDSEGRVFRKLDSELEGRQKTHYEVQPFYDYPHTTLLNATKYGDWANKQLVGGSQPFLDIHQYNPNQIRVKVHADKLNINDFDRYYDWGYFDGRRPAVVWLSSARINRQIFETPDITYDGTFTGFDSDLNFNAAGTNRAFHGVRQTDKTNDSEMNFTVQGTINDDFEFAYSTEFGDHYLDVIDPRREDDSDYLRHVKTGIDSEIFSSFDDNAGEPWWKVFNDSENDGFKTATGVEIGHIGVRRLEKDNYDYRLKQVIMTNTPATKANNRPYRFRVEGYTEATNTWTQIVAIEEFDGYVWNYTLPDTHDDYYDAFRMRFVACQPGYDSAYNQLEVKALKFITTRRSREIMRKGRGFTVETADKPFRFYTGDEHILCDAQVIGGGGGGGRSAQFHTNTSTTIGSGGGGGAYVGVTDLLLNPHTEYELKVGAGGGSMEDGEDSYLKDLTNNNFVLLAEGGGFGGAGAEAGHTPIQSAGRGPGGKAYVDRTFHQIGSDDLDNGANGGAANSQNPGVTAEDGGAGRRRALVTVVDQRTLSSTMQWTGGGGGAGTRGDIFFEGVQQEGGDASDPSAGDGVGSNRIFATAGVDKRGGGGGGGGVRTTGGGAPGAAGGFGFASIVFK